MKSKLNLAGCKNKELTNSIDHLRREK